MLRRPTFILVVFLLLPSTVQADRVEGNRSAMKKRSNVSSNSSLSQRTIYMDAPISQVTDRGNTWSNSSMPQSIITRHVDMNMPVSLVLHGSGVIHKARTRPVGKTGSAVFEAGNAHDILAKDDHLYGICCLKVATKGEHDHLEYVEKADKETSEFIPVGDKKKIADKMKECNLMAVCKGTTDCTCSDVFHNTVEYHELRKKSLLSLKVTQAHEMNAKTQVIDEEIIKHEKELEKINLKVKEAEDKVTESKNKRVEKEKPFQEEIKALDQELKQTEEERKAVLEQRKQEVGDYEQKKSDFETTCRDTGDKNSKLGCCCQLGGEMYVLKPASKFAYVKCEKKGRYTESVWSHWSCGQGWKVSGPKDAFFWKCPKCNDMGHIRS